MAKAKEKLLTETMAPKNPPGLFLKLLLRFTPLVLAIVLVLLSTRTIAKNYISTTSSSD